MLTTTSTPRLSAPVPRSGLWREGTDAGLTFAGASPDRATSPVPCAARPSTRFVHDDGPCRCFFGGPAPQLVAATPLHGAS